MSHLSLETLARIVDEAPSIEEARHLDGCEACRVELEALREDVQALALLPVMKPAPDAWETLERRLVDEGLVRERRVFATTSWPARAAAAIALFIAGSLAGRMTATSQPITTAQLDAPAAQTGVSAPAGANTGWDAGYAAGLAAGAGTNDAGQLVDPDARLAANDAGSRRATPARPDPAATPRLESPARLASNTNAPRTMDEAAALLRQTEDLYLTALTRYAELATQSEAGDPIARLAALQSIVMTTNAALNQAPADPVINGVHLAALAQRDATLAQVAAATGERWY